jgi:serine/threonine protein kinase
MLPTTPPGTLPGVVLGTVGYMAPEQVRGLVADHRSDIFAFGVVLYEMLSGRRAFRGDTTAETMTAILKEEPADLSAGQRHIPPGLARIVDRCLEKSPAARFQSAGDLAFALEALSGQSGTAEAVAAPVATSRDRLAWMVATAALIAAVALFIPTMRHLREVPAQAPEIRLEVVTPPSGDLLSLAISPDGRQLAFVATAEGSARPRWHLEWRWRHRLSTGRKQQSAPSDAGDRRLARSGDATCSQPNDEPLSVVFT